MPLSYRNITKDKTIADILDKHNQPITLIGEPEELNRLLIDNDYQPIDFTIEDNQRESRFIAFLDKHYKGKLKETLYIDYTESLSAEDMAKFVNETLEYNTPIKALVSDYIRENSDWCPEFEVIKAFVEATNQNEEDFFDGGPTDLCEYYRELFDEYVELDYGAKDLLKNSTPEDLTIFFGDYWDDTCENVEEHYNQGNKSIATPIEWLLETQGYTEDDLHDKAKRQESVFLKSLYDELYDMSDLSNFQLVAIPDSNNWEAIIALNYNYFYQYDFPKRTLTDLREELTTAIAIVDQLDGKVNYEEVHDAKHTLNPIELTDENITVSFNKQTNNRIIVKAEKTTHTYKDGFITTLDDVTTLKTYGFDDDVSQTICDTRTLTDFNQLHPLLKDMIQNINNWQTKTTIV